MKYPTLIAAGGVFISGFLLTASGQNVLTYHNDLARTGLNPNESILTPATVASTNFGRLFSQPVDGYVYAQPLVVTNVSIPGYGTHNVVYVATEHDSVYAFDADSTAGPGGGLLWQVSLGTSAVTPNNDFGMRYGPYADIYPEVGITSTPVIDPGSGTIYVDALTHEGNAYYHRIHALNLTNGAEAAYSPVTVTASVAGQGVDSANGVVSFNARQENQRSALTLAGGILYVAYAGYGDTDPYHGWVIGFNATNLVQLTNYVFNSTPNSGMGLYGPNAGEGGIWMSGDGLAVDAQTNLYLVIGNGSFNGDQPGATEYGDSAVKLSTTNGLSVADFFTPYDQAMLAVNDLDFGSGGAMLLPDAEGSLAHPHLMVAAGKEGTIYLLDRDQMGGIHSGSDSQIVESIPGAIAGDGSFDTPAYFNHTLYYAGSRDVLNAFAITNGMVATSPTDHGLDALGFSGATPSISANGTTNGIVWIIQNAGSAILRAYDAAHVETELYNSSAAGLRDDPGGAVKFTVPTVANGKVYVGTRRALAVYGLSPSLSQPALTNRVTISPSDAWIGYLNIFNLSGTFQFGYPSDPVTLPATYEGYLLTLTPNTGLYDPTSSYWVNADGSGAELIDASMYVEDGGLAGSPLIFTGYCLSNTLVAPYKATAFIKEFNSGYSSLVQSTTAPLVGGQTFQLSLASTSPSDHVQYGLETIGPDANPDTVASLGTVVLEGNTNSPAQIMNLTKLVNGAVHLVITNLPGSGGTVFASTNVADPFNLWFNLGPELESPASPGQFQFTDPQGAANPSRFYRLRSP